MKPKIFISSSNEGKKFADYIGKELEKCAECEIWYENVFTISNNTQESLVNRIQKCDFVIAILTADDKTTSRGTMSLSPRDNLILEIGIGFGAINTKRTFIVRDNNIKIPTNLDGFTLTKKFNSNNKDLQESLTTAVNQIKDSVRTLGLRLKLIRETKEIDDIKELGNDLIRSASQNIIMFGGDLSWAPYYVYNISQKKKDGISTTAIFEKEKSSNESQRQLENAGVDLIHVEKDLGIRMTMIDHERNNLCRFMMVSKHRNPGDFKKFSYEFEIHSAETSKIELNTLSRLYDSIKDSHGKRK